MSSASPTLRLGELRRRLGQLRARRWFVRMGSGWTALVTASIVTLAIAFVADFVLELRWIERLAVLLMVVLAGLWAFRKYTRPFLGVNETELDMALLVERRQKIDSDLVAALQFEQPQPTKVGPTLGSHELREAVIEYVADFGKSIDVFAGISHNQFRRRYRWCLVASVAALLAVAIYPKHAAAFFNRLLLGSAHYPTATEIADIRVNDRPALYGAMAEPLPGLPDGVPVKFAVRLSGVRPESAEVRLRSDRTGGLSTLPLRMAESDAEYFGILPRLAENASFQVFAGDAWTEPVSLRVVERPVVSLSLDVTPPEYARSARRPAGEGARQIAVIEGSRVALSVSCANKGLKTVKVAARDQSFDLTATGTDSREWTLAGSDHPFARIDEPLSFEVTAQDVDGLDLIEPLAGHIRILADRSPRVAAAVVTEKVLPGAKPSVAFGATDDYGLATVRLKWELVRGDGSTEQGSREMQKRGPQEGIETVWRGKFAFDLKDLKSRKGDEIRVFVEAEDYRGVDAKGAPVAGKTSSGESIVFQVTDESGILAGLVEADEKSARQLDGIIQRQLGIGAGP
jgi:hypothetical protein